MFSTQLVPEAYRQRFRSWRKSERQTHVEVTRELSNHFDRWCATSNVQSFSELREMMIIEQLKNIVPDQIAVYINENKPCTAIEAASLADDFVLTHKNRFSYGNRGNGSLYLKQSQHNNRGSPSQRVITDSMCRYCLEVGHWKNECPVLKSKQGRGKNKNSAPVLLTSYLSQVPPVHSTENPPLSEDASCVVTRSKTKMMDDENVNLCDTCIPVKSVVPGLSLFPKISRAELVAAQRDDPGLKSLFTAVLPPEDVESAATGYFIDDGVLLRKWLAQKEDCGGESFVQVVVPEKFRDVVLRLAHGDIAGHFRHMAKFCSIFIGHC
ncbi:Zinc finger and SCAN domain-containing protein 25 [Labeo rohita]|uniref:Zinc finger and SCAN domain-containing protein 25 n=1 Tax=Labeo rohita TaxID=84645 RepID=A0ABQ8M120_LABRO|nr:Zinc finger and SCAN domain-containing protein 25 [Labeo rohita]